MLTETHLQLHKKSIDIIEAIQRCDRLMKDAKRYLNNNTEAPWFDYTKHIYVKQFNKYRAIKNRLLRSYANVIQQLVFVPVENAKVIGTITINSNGVAEPAY